MKNKTFSVAELERGLGWIRYHFDGIDPYVKPYGDTLLAIAADKELSGDKIDLITSKSWITKQAVQILRDNFEDVDLKENKITLKSYDVPVQIKLLSNKYDYFKNATPKFYRSLKVNEKQWVTEAFYIPNPLEGYKKYLQEGGEFL